MSNVLLFVCFFFLTMYVFCFGVALLYAYWFSSWVGGGVAVLFGACTALYLRIILKDLRPKLFSLVVFEDVLDD
ncbi:hypothetical protein [Aureispira sp. CCB-E]|uniref:hypothetical protein n=1 Tax=Aureispira sp. CCB-E TaxID=3051121 RepID=UPI002868C8D3|nr:hypothetical protein [Aureispira sp. CCB-E]WMX17465.1 hypothetical protein QP953_13875 [Aureispira sp. CCB-E]